ncbi:hypothetical protein PISMIDRAFT_631865 [Pisolithus microcarpus 441]|uniref:Uncharacterized protein n=1 Tax=Pisolithus microcarpus 441 TaxID=765257 RepID=A0A0C9Y1A8_9AGAM|nr:hypothetical protein BKA83DRAFT_631865 [Pisolithus microcarpus]KIK18460.1 hypothetical protein PISMIDRAFT_631865 [Pisolithus microcarpus 441]
MATKFGICCSNVQTLLCVKIDIATPPCLEPLICSIYMLHCQEAMANPKYAYCVILMRTSF